jgi:hypothetical protein
MTVCCDVVDVASGIVPDASHASTQSIRTTLTLARQ